MALDDDLTTSLAPWRPRGRKWKVEETCKGFGEDGKGDWEEGMQLETQEEKLIVDDGLDEFDEALGRFDELVGVEVVDREVEHLQLEDPPLLPHQ